MSRWLHRSRVPCAVMDDEQGPKNLAEMLTKLAERKWTQDDFVQWWTYTGTSFPGAVWADPTYQRIKQLGWCVVDHRHCLQIQSVHTYLPTNCAVAKLNGAGLWRRSFEPLGPKGCGFYFAPPPDAETVAMLSKLSLSTFIPASSFGGRKESYAFKCDGGKMGYFLDPHQSACVLRRGIALWQRFAWAAGATHERLSADSVCALVPLELISKVSDCVPALGSLEVYLRWRDEQSGGGGSSGVQYGPPQCLPIATQLEVRTVRRWLRAGSYPLHAHDCTHVARSLDCSSQH